MPGYDTNLAAEFYVLSCLHRLGIAAALTLGNKKGVDIIVARAAGDAATVEVKGVAGPYDWTVGTIQPAHPDRHYVVLVGFEGRINEPAMPAPKVWVLPFQALTPFLRPYDGRTNVSRADINERGVIYENAWHHIETMA
jgi:hypothetical protein